MVHSKDIFFSFCRVCALSMIMEIGFPYFPVFGAECIVTPKSLAITLSRAPVVSEPVEFTVEAVSNCAGERYYLFTCTPDYGSPSYDPSLNWVNMASGSRTPVFTSANSIQYAFPAAGHYIVIAEVSLTPSPPSPRNIIGCSLTVTPYADGSPGNPSTVPDTGQIESFTDVVGEDSDYILNPKSYTKLGADGTPLSEAAGEWAMVRDNVTGLIWEMKTDDGGIHDKDNIYTWAEAQNAFIVRLNADHFGGRADWRLPTVKEISTLVNADRYTPSINTAFFPHTEPVSFWSSTTEAYNPVYAWYVSFKYGTILGSFKTIRLNVRAVCGDTPAILQDSIAPGRMRGNSDGTVTDLKTGLMWQQGDPGRMSWIDALNYCENLWLAGYGDWRLPNIQELMTLADYTTFNPIIDPLVFPGAVPLGYWSSTSCAGNPDNAWHLHLSLGGVGYGNRKSSQIHVRAVRGGN